MSTIVTVLENRVIYQEKESFERAGSLKNGSFGAPPFVANVQDSPASGQAPSVRPVGGIHF